MWFSTVFILYNYLGSFFFKGLVPRPQPKPEGGAKVQPVVFVFVVDNLFFNSLDGDLSSHWSGLIQISLPVKCCLDPLPNPPFHPRYSIFPISLSSRFIICFFLLSSFSLRSSYFYLVSNSEEVYLWTSLVAQMVKCLPTMWETWVQSLGREDPPEKDMATHSSTLAWRIPWMEEPGGLKSMGPQRVGHD